MALIQTDAVEVRRAGGKGLGVFARRPIRAGEVIERVPVIVLPAREIEDDSGATTLAGYCFVWARGKVAVALGYGSLYNHSYRPNARYEDRGRRTKLFTALRDIAAGEEITINYNGEPRDRSPVGFDVLAPAAPPARAAARRLSRSGNGATAG
jgi:uncharacterized protein